MALPFDTSGRTELGQLRKVTNQVMS